MQAPDVSAVMPAEIPDQYAFERTVADRAAHRRGGIDRSLGGSTPEDITNLLQTGMSKLCQSGSTLTSLASIKALRE